MKFDTVMTVTDTQLKQSLAKMLPSKLALYGDKENILCWADHDRLNRPTQVLDTELLHLCRDIELALPDYDYNLFCNLRCEEKERNREMRSHQSASWQQRTLALCKVKGVEIV